MAEWICSIQTESPEFSKRVQDACFAAGIEWAILSGRDYVGVDSRHLTIGKTCSGKIQLFHGHGSYGKHCESIEEFIRAAQPRPEQVYTAVTPETSKHVQEMLFKVGYPGDKGAFQGYREVSNKEFVEILGGTWVEPEPPKVEVDLSRNYYLQVTPEQSRYAQKLMFSLGYGWSYDKDQTVKNTDKKFLCPRPSAGQIFQTNSSSGAGGRPVYQFEDWKAAWQETFPPPKPMKRTHFCEDEAKEWIEHMGIRVDVRSTGEVTYKLRLTSPKLNGRLDIPYYTALRTPTVYDALSCVHADTVGIDGYEDAEDYVENFCGPSAKDTLTHSEYEKYVKSYHDCRRMKEKAATWLGKHRETFEKFEF